MRPTFEGVLGGFDDKATPKWKMVGLNKKAVVWLNNGDGTDVRVTVPGVVQIEEVPLTNRIKQPNGEFITVPSNVKNLRIFGLTGTMPGKTIVEVRKDGRLLENLEVEVLDSIECTVTFNFVSDSAKHKTVRDKSKLDEMLMMTNLIFSDEANIKIIKHDVRDVHFDRDLGGVVMAQNVWDIIAARRDRTAIFNVFFVWEYEQDDTPKVDNTEAAALNRVCLFEDNAIVDHSVILAHELVHLMGLPHFQKKDFIMNETGEGFKFTKNQVLKMRSILRHIKKLAK